MGLVLYIQTSPALSLETDYEPFCYSLSVHDRASSLPRACSGLAAGATLVSLLRVQGPSCPPLRTTPDCRVGQVPCSKYEVPKVGLLFGVDIGPIGRPVQRERKEWWLAHE